VVIAQVFPRRRSPIVVATAAARAIGILLATLTIPACFDVRHVDPGDGTFVIDDFEDGDTLPATPLLDRWACDTFNPDTGQDPDQTVSCGLETPGHDSQYGLSAVFALHDGTEVNPDGTPAGTEYAGAGLQTMVDTAALDLTSYAALVFDIKVEFEDAPPPMTGVDVQLGCNSVTPSNTANVGQLYFDLWYPIAATPSWQNVKIPLSSFTQRQDELNLFADGAKSCLAVIDSIRFEVVEPLTFGQSGSGVIHIDDIHLVRNPPE
jgi:hypothetical protein